MSNRRVQQTHIPESELAFQVQVWEDGQKTISVADSQSFLYGQERLLKRIQARRTARLERERIANGAG